MDAQQFDAFSRAVSRPRRVVAGGILGLALTPLATTAKRKKHKKKKKKATCKAPGISCGKNLCCGSTQQCVSGQCQDVSPCGPQACAGYTNPVMQGGACVCRATINSPSLCFAQQPCEGLSPCAVDGKCSEGYACMDNSCGGKPTCVRTCV
ncbi:MAG: hypothetical protein JNM64_06685 [Chloroflexia bacterium]|nr:hypothetical protein [Chloroflexia bacterium]